jgi:hypothetical protein
MSGARQKAAAFRRAARPTGNFQKSCFFSTAFPRPTIIQHFGWKSPNSPTMFVWFFKFRLFPKIRYKLEIQQKG